MIFLRWAGYVPDEDSWVPWNNVQETRAIEIYAKKQKLVLPEEDKDNTEEVFGRMSLDDIINSKVLGPIIADRGRTPERRSERVASQRLSEERRINGATPTTRYRLI